MINLFEKLLPVETETGIRIYEDLCEEPADKYIVYTVEGERPVLNGDNAVLADTVYVSIQLVVPMDFDYVGMKYKIRDTLEKNGFCVTDIQTFSKSELNGTDKIRRVIFDANYTTNH